MQKGQIQPNYRFPHDKVVISDVSQRTETIADVSSLTKMLFVFTSPKGPGTLRTISGGLNEFVEVYGEGPFSVYGQPYLNARVAASTGEALLQCLRITADNAYHSNVALVAKYNADTVDSKLTVKFDIRSNAAMTSLDKLEDPVSVVTEPDEDGFVEVHLFSVAAVSKGISGDDLAIRLSTYNRGDKTNAYKNYVLETYEKTVQLDDGFRIAFSEDAIQGEDSVFADGVVNDPINGSSYVNIHTNLAGFATLYNAYKTVSPDTNISLEQFDPLLGINKFTGVALDNFEIITDEENPYALNQIEGIKLISGSDGDFGANVEKDIKDPAVEAKYIAAFMGTVDNNILSKNAFPVDIILDANYSSAVKSKLAALGVTRSDCTVYLDIGTDIDSKSALIEEAESYDVFATSYVQTLDGYYGKAKDPYSKKIYKVSSTYGLAKALPLHFKTYGGKHIPFAGAYGIFNSYIPGSIFPIFDNNIDQVALEKLVDLRCNYASIDSRGNIIRTTQTTRQETASKLSECNNVHIVLDIKRDVEKLLANYSYNFNEVSDLSRFNSEIEMYVLAKYRAQQVKSISGEFSRTDWEAENGILHLVIELQNKDIGKRNIVEIVVNK